MAGRAESSRAKVAARRLLGWPARRVLDRRVEWILESLHPRLDLLETELRHATQALGESLLSRRLATLASENDPALPGDTARFLNWAEGHEGPAARASLWFNAPVPVMYAEDKVEVLLVNERIVEQPYVFGALAGLSRGARILDVGGAESTVALSLASLGHEVHVVDPRGYRLEHPDVHVHAVAVGELASELRFDAAVALSSVEHFGLGAYGTEHDELRLDRAALADVHDRLVPGGLLVLTVPCAQSSAQDDFQRVYSFSDLRELLAVWEVLDLSVAWRRDRLTWIRGVPEEPRGERGVALVSARRGDR